jgi:hypothetical protein
MIRPEVQTERHKHRQQQTTEADVFRQIDEILELLDTPELAVVIRKASEADESRDR